MIEILLYVDYEDTSEELLKEIKDETVNPLGLSIFGSKVDNENVCLSTIIALVEKKEKKRRFVWEHRPQPF